MEFALVCVEHSENELTHSLTDSLSLVVLTHFYSFTHTHPLTQLFIQIIYFFTDSLIDSLIHYSHSLTRLTH